MSNSWGLGEKSWWPPGQEAADEYVAYASEYSKERCAEQFDRVSSLAGSYVTGDKIGSALKHSIENHIKTRTPGSFIRLGDADGNALFHRMGKYPALADYCIRKISKIYFGNDALMGEHSSFFANIVLEALENADGIGAPERVTVLGSFDKPYPELDVRGMCGMRGVYNYLDEHFDLQKLSQATWTSTWYSRSLLPHYFGLMKDLPYVGFITCYPELAGLFQKKAGIKEVETILVPMQSSIAYQTKRAPHMAKDIGHYPGAYPNILDAIKPPHDGAVYIIAAGILSKSYCTAVKQRGGISIDVGSVADVWMNTRSRPDMGADITKWSLLEA